MITTNLSSRSKKQPLPFTPPSANRQVGVFFCWGATYDGKMTGYDKYVEHDWNYNILFNKTYIQIFGNVFKYRKMENNDLVIK